jgi:16S rRNA (cytosine967-C5)-methyltransferase
MTDVFKQGFFEVQDANSQLVAAFLMLNQECV